MGDIGEETDIVDILGNKLYVGDTILVYENKEKYGERVICKHKDEEYVMGLRYLKWEKGYGYNYNIIKSRNYEEIKNGEDINGVKYILEEGV